MIARSYFLLATLFLILGMTIGIFMGASGDHRLASAHAHINLLGFVLFMLFGLVFAIVPQMAASPLARVQLWLHGIGTIGMLVMLSLYLLGKISPEAMGMSAPFQFAVLAGALVFLANLWRNLRA